MVREVLHALKVSPGMRVIDATVNGGGHSEELAKLLKGEGTLLSIDHDRGALERARKRLEPYGTLVRFAQSNFKDIVRCANEAGIEKADAVLFDLGFSSNQLDASGRGFSFLKDEPLLMTYKETPEITDFTARDIVNSWEESTIADVIYGYGEERHARRIARAIVAARKKSQLETTFDLTRVIEDAVGKRRGKINPATKTFQALRIAVNDELSSLTQGLHGALNLLAPSGCIAVISFHSLEDRIVKNIFRDAQKLGKGNASKKPLVADSKEIKDNPRARSAKLRTFIANSRNESF
jgi:16S rRNA (cytosine1402-N4)-methyltransferase